MEITMCKKCGKSVLVTRYTYESDGEQVHAVRREHVDPRAGHPPEA